MTIVDGNQYVYTESFDDLDTINIKYSSKDLQTNMPSIDLEAGTVQIPDNSIQLVDLSHYYGKKVMEH